MLSPQGRAAEKTLNALEKAVATARRHGPEHRSSLRNAEEAHQTLQHYAAEFDRLTVSVRPHGLIVAEEVVLGSQEYPAELMRLLLPEGISQLTFDPTLPQRELDSMIRVLAEHWRDESGLQLAGDGRLLCALWGLGLTQLGYRVYDPLSANATRLFQRKAALGTGVLDHSPQLAPVASRMGDLVEEILLAEDQRDPSTHFFKQLRRDQRLVLQSSGWGPLPERSKEFLASDDGAERRSLLQRLPAQDEARSRASKAVEWACAQPKGAPEPVEVGRFLAALAVLSLKEGDVTAAAESLAKIYDLGQTEEVRRVVTLRLGGRGGLQLVARALRSQADSLDPDELIHLGLDYFAHLDDQAVHPACKLYASISHSDVRRVFRRFLTSRIKTHADLIEPLTRVQEEVIAREAIGILALAPADSRARELLEAAAEGDEPRASMAKEAIDVVTGERKRRELARIVLESDDRRERLAAIKGLKADGSQRAFEELAEVVRTPEFCRRDEDEAQLAFDALTALGGVRSVRTLQEIAGRKQGLFGRRQRKQMSRVASAWLRKLKEKGR